MTVSPSGPVPDNSSVTLTCTSAANPAVRSYTWFTADGGQDTFIGTGQTLTIKASELTAPFFCVAENPLGSGRSNITHIDVQCTYHMIQCFWQDSKSRASCLSVFQSICVLNACPSRLTDFTLGRCLVKGVSECGADSGVVLIRNTGVFILKRNTLWLLPLQPLPLSHSTAPVIITNLVASVGSTLPC